MWIPAVNLISTIIFCRYFSRHLNLLVHFCKILPHINCECSCKFQNHCSSFIFSRDRKAKPMTSCWWFRLWGKTERGLGFILPSYFAAWPNITWRTVLSGLGSIIFHHFSREYFFCLVQILVFCSSKNILYFYRLQPNLDTRKKQIEGWCDLVLAYYKYHKSHILDVNEAQSSEIFCNKKIDRILSIIIMFVFNRSCDK